MQQLQGIWVDAETESVALRIDGDSVFYPDSISQPVRFAIFADTLVVYAASAVRYPIIEQGNYIFKYETLSGEVMNLRRSEVSDDSLAFKNHAYAPILLNEQVHRDSVLFAPNGSRYHLYVDVNPTRYKVHHTSYTDEGLPKDEVYFDNIIHVAVYQGEKRIFSQDFAKKDFQELIPASFIKGALLSNMDIAPLTNDSCSFHATLCQPDGASCYVIIIKVSYDGNYTMELLEY